MHSKSRPRRRVKGEEVLKRVEGVNEWVEEKGTEMEHEAGTENALGDRE